MDQLKAQAPHMVIAIVITIGLIVLAVKGSIPGSDAFGGIMAIGGFSSGGAIGSLSSSDTETPTVNVPVKVAAATTQSPSSSTSPAPTEHPLT